MRFTLARRVPNENRLPRRRGKFLEGDHSLSGGRSPKTGRAARRTCHAERASAGRRCFGRSAWDAYRKSTRSGKPVKRKQEGVAGCGTLTSTSKWCEELAVRRACWAQLRAADTKDTWDLAVYTPEKCLVPIRTRSPRSQFRANEPRR